MCTNECRVLINVFFYKRFFDSAKLVNFDKKKHIFALKNHMLQIHFLKKNPQNS